MTTLLNAVLLNALLATGLAVLIWTAAIIPAVRRRPGLRHALWLIVLLKLVTPPLLEVSILPISFVAEVKRQPDLRAIPLNDIPLDAPAEALVVPNGATGREIPQTVPTARRIDWMVVLAVVSALGTLTVLLLAATQVWRLRGALARSAANDEGLSTIALKSARQMGLSAAPAVCGVAVNVSPLLWVRKSGPLVVIPRRLVDQMSDEQLGCIVSHEIAHYLRWDHWTNLLSLLVAAIYWWNPVVWWARRELRTAQEACCDALVLSRSVATRRTYAESLFQALEFMQAKDSLSPALASSFGGKSSTRRRFEMIANPRVNHRLSWWSYPVLLGAVAVLPCVPVRGDHEPADTAQHKTAGAKDNPAAKESRMWKLQEPSGTDWYIHMEGFEGRIVEGWFAGGGGVVLDLRPPEDVPGDGIGVIPVTFGFVTGGPSGGGFPEWIRAYRFDPDAKEFDGSWYGLSVDTESGRVVVREVVDAELAAEIRRKAPGVPILLPRDAKVWRVVIHDDLQRPSERKDAPKNGGKADDGKRHTAAEKDDSSAMPGRPADAAHDLVEISIGPADGVVDFRDIPLDPRDAR